MLKFEKSRILADAIIDLVEERDNLEFMEVPGVRYLSQGNDINECMFRVRVNGTTVMVRLTEGKWAEY